MQGIKVNKSKLLRRLETCLEVIQGRELVQEMPIKGAIDKQARLFIPKDGKLYRVPQPIRLQRVNG